MQKMKFYYSSSRVIDLLRCKYNVVGADQEPWIGKVVFVLADPSDREKIKAYIHSLE